MKNKILLQIDEKIRIKTDEHNYIIERLSTPDPKKPSKKFPDGQWTIWGYYGRLSTAFKGILELQIREKTYKDISELKEFVEGAVDKLSKIGVDDGQETKSNRCSGEDI